MTPEPSAPLAIDDSGIALCPDSGRTILRFFVPGQEDVGPGDSRAGAVIDRMLGLTDMQVDAALADVQLRIGDRHPSFDDTLERNADLIAHRLEGQVVLTTPRRRLLGATFTHEYAIEGAALCNPSVVIHPHQPDDGGTAIVLSVRGIGEGHRSSIGFRTGRVDAAGRIAIDPPGPLPLTANATPGIHHRSVLHRKLAELGDDHENAAFVIDAVPEQFDDAVLHERVDALSADTTTRRNTATTAVNLLQIASCSYHVEFPPTSELSERVLWPHSAAEQHGMEDARFVEITDGSGPRYCATYTAFDGAHIAQHLLTTDDFLSFDVSPMAGAAARGKGLALFPRQIGGRFAALSRADRETNSIAFSDDLRCWDSSVAIQSPVQPWEILQLGNCGSPIETEWGWLVLTHGVGPLRTYSIGAMLLGLDDPQHVVAVGEHPFLCPGKERRNGYVPNVVYSCGAVALGDRLVLPYGVGDQTIAIASLSIAELVTSMVPVGS